MSCTSQSCRTDEAVISLSVSLPSCQVGRTDERTVRRETTQTSKIEVARDYTDSIKWWRFRQIIQMNIKGSDALKLRYVHVQWLRPTFAFSGLEMLPLSRSHKIEYS